MSSSTLLNVTATATSPICFPPHLLLPIDIFRHVRVAFRTMSLRAVPRDTSPQILGECDEFNVFKHVDAGPVSTKMVALETFRNWSVNLAPNPSRVSVDAVLHPKLSVAVCVEIPRPDPTAGVIIKSNVLKESLKCGTTGRGTLSRHRELILSGVARQAVSSGAVALFYHEGDTNT